MYKLSEFYSKKNSICYNIIGDNMKTNKKIIFFILTTIILGSITYLIIRNMNKENGNEVLNENKAAIIEDIDYAKYLELRSKAHETETYAIIIWNSTDNVSTEYLKEIEIAFENRTSVVYLLDRSKLSDADFSRVIDDATEIMKYKAPTIIIPMTILMSKGEIVYKHTGLMYKEELIDNLNAKSIE